MTQYSVSYFLPTGEPAAEIFNANYAFVEDDGTLVLKNGNLSVVAIFSHDGWHRVRQLEGD